MARQRMTELRVGLFLFVGSIVLMLIIFMLGSQRDLFQRKYTLYTSFPSSSGLRRGASVSLAGIRVGSVEDVSFVGPLKDRRVTVTLRIKRSYQDRIRADSQASIETQGLLGDKFVAISLGSEAEPILEHQAWIASKESPTLWDMAEKAGKAMEGLLSGGRDKHGDLPGLLGSLRRTIEEIEKGKGVLHQLIYDPNGEKFFSNLEGTSTNVYAITTAIKDGEGTLGRLVRDPTLYEDARTLMGRASRSKLLRAVIRATIRENEKQTLK